MFGSEYRDIGLLLENMGHISGNSHEIEPGLERVARLYVRMLGVPEVGMRLRAMHFKKKARMLKFNSVLDAGCGIGLYSFHLGKKFPGVKITAYDLNGRNISTCNRIRSALGLGNVDFRRKDLSKIDDQRKYDLIFNIDVLEHIPDDRRTLKNFYNALRPGGRLILNVPNRHQKRHFRRFESWEHDDHVRDGYTADEIRKLLAEAGFTTIEVSYNFGWFGSLAWELNHLGMKSLPLSALLFPFCMLIGSVDLLKSNRTGNGIMVVAEK